MKSNFKMTIRELLIFFAGMEAFHTLSHVILSKLVIFPWHTKFITVTAAVNMWAIFLNGAVTFGLLYWAGRTRK